MKPTNLPYQPFLLRCLHGLTGIFLILAMISAFWTYNTYDGRWGTLPLPRFEEIEGIHGTFGLYTLLIFPAFVFYAFHRGHQRLAQPRVLPQLTHKVGTWAWWHTLSRCGRGRCRGHGHGERADRRHRALRALTELRTERAQR